MLDNKNNKRIAKNTLLLYGRMLLTMGVSFYTSRVILDVLGVSDYGVNNVVGGIVAMGSFLNTSMASALQRFLSFELGRGDREGLREVFSTSVLTQSLAAAVVFVLAETVGLWFLNTHINIDAERMAAANWVYQCAIVSFVLIMVSAPYNAVLIAHEHMTVFAYFGIIEAGLRLAIVFLLQLSLGDKLIVYALLGLAVSMIMRLLYGVYCHRRFEECVYRFRIYRQRLRQMLAFSGWNMIGTSSLVFRDQGVNIILNLFFGTTVNAARAVAMQVNSAVMNFTNNFLLALSPQITKQYAEGDVAHSMRLVFTGCRFSGYLVLLMIVPLMSTMDYLLLIWLETVPSHTTAFLKIVLIFTLFRTMQFPLITAIHATGHICRSQVMICMVNLSEVVMAYVILCGGGQLYAAVSLSIATALINLCGYVVCLKRLVPYSCKLRTFVTGILLRIVVIALLCHVVTECFHGLFDEDNIVSFLATVFVSVLFTGSMIYAFGLSHSERSFINKRVVMMIKRIVVNFYQQ